MGQRQIAVVLVKLGAIFFVIYSLQNVSYLLGYVGASADYIKVAALSFLLIGLIPWLIAAALWKFPNHVVSQLSETEEGENVEVSDLNHPLLIGVSLIGVYAVTFGIIDLMYYEAMRLTSMDLARQYGSENPTVSLDIIAGRYTNILQIVLGALLIVGRQTISSFLIRVRRAGT